MRTHPRAIPVDEAPLTPRSAEVLRVWITDRSGSTVLIAPDVLADAEMFGVLMADAIDHAAKAHAQALDMTQEQAATLIWRGLDRARAAIEGGSTNLDDGGRIN
ncbi:MAG TPA: DUF5076 domain-containing protein [Sphingomonas sp.]